MWYYKSIFDESINQTENGFEIKRNVPGYGKEDLVIEIENNILNVKSKDEVISFAYSLSPNVDIKSIEAKCDKGVLVITLNKNKDSIKTIEIK